MLFIYWYLVTGDSYQTIAFYYCISKACVSKIVPETNEAVWTTMQPIVMPFLVDRTGVALLKILIGYGISRTV